MSEELGRRAIACKGWRWMPGMRDTRGFLRGFTGWLADDDGWRALFGTCEHSQRCELDAYPPHLPDLTDPATLGCLLALVREAAAAPHFAVSWYDEGPGSSCWPGEWWSTGVEGGNNARGPSCIGGTEAEALVVALESATHFRDQTGAEMAREGRTI